MVLLRIGTIWSDCGILRLSGKCSLTLLYCCCVSETVSEEFAVCVLNLGLVKCCRCLGVDPSEHNVLMTASTQTSKHQKERMLQLLFERLDVGGTYIADQAVLSLYGCGLVSGLVYSSGDGVTSVVPVYEGTKTNCKTHTTHTHNVPLGANVIY
jgi:hypothetical protein